jgi:hypothetical protein
MKTFTLLSILVLGSGAFAAPSTEIIFHRKNHLGFERTDNISLDGKYSYINGLSLTKIPAAKLKTAVGKILDFKSVSDSNCSMGEYQLKIKNAGKETKQNGCMSGENYADLVVSVEDLKDLARGAK